MFNATYRKILTNIFSILFLFNFLLADPSEMPVNTISLNDNGDVWYNVDTDIAGFQFSVDGTTVSGASGGDAAANGFTVSPGGSTVLGFSFTGATIPSGYGTLVTLALNGTATGLSGIVFSDSAGNGFDVAYYSGNDCASGVFDCEGVCDGTAVEDCAGVCGGDAVVGGCDNVCGSTAVEDLSLIHI